MVLEKGMSNSKLCSVSSNKALFTSLHVSACVPLHHLQNDRHFGRRPRDSFDMFGFGLSASVTNEEIAFEAGQSVP